MIHDLEALGELLLFGLGLGGLRFFAQEHLDFLKVQLFEQAADGFRAHAHGKGVLAEMVDDLEVLPKRIRAIKAARTIPMIRFNVPDFPASMTP